MLTPEERQRIEDEERKRIAEEQYRAEVRARFQQPQQDPPAPVEKAKPDSLDTRNRRCLNCGRGLADQQPGPVQSQR